MEYNSIQDTTAFIQAKYSHKPLVGVVLGTGLNALIEKILDQSILAYDTIPNFPISTVEFHKGQLVFGTIASVPLVVMQGRFHYYEGYSMQQITFPIRVMKALGIEYLLLSNAAGGLDTTFKKGDLVITEDHLNFLPDNPLRGLSHDFGNKFTDMSEPYDVNLRKHLKESFANAKVDTKTGTYVSVMGPNLETKAEYRWLKNSGADMVGMSTVPEVIVANQLGIKCAAVSVITDECDPENLKPIDIREIIRIAGQADIKLADIFVDVISKLTFTDSSA